MFRLLWVIKLPFCRIKQVNKYSGVKRFWGCNCIDEYIMFVLGADPIFFQQGWSNESGRYINEALGNDISNTGLLANIFHSLTTYFISLREMPPIGASRGHYNSYRTYHHNFFQNDLWLHLLTWSNLIRAWISKHTPSKSWEKYPSIPNLKWCNRWSLRMAE